VGVTRAAETLFLTYSEARSIRGKRRASAPSPYLADMEEEIKRRFDTRYGKKGKSRKGDAGQMTLF